MLVEAEWKTVWILISWLLSVDPDQLDSQKPADQDLHCLKQDISGLSMVKVKKIT